MFHGNYRAMLPIAVPVILYLVLFLFLSAKFFTQKNFDAIFLIALIGWPCSLIANAVSGYVDYFIWGDRNVYIDLAALLAFGVLQYGLVGFVLYRGFQYLRGQMNPTRR